MDDDFFQEDNYNDLNSIGSSYSLQSHKTTLTKFDVPTLDLNKIPAVKQARLNDEEIVRAHAADDKSRRSSTYNKKRREKKIKHREQKHGKHILSGEFQNDDSDDLLSIISVLTGNTLDTDISSLQSKAMRIYENVIDKGLASTPNITTSLFPLESSRERIANQSSFLLRRKNKRTVDDFGKGPGRSNSATSLLLERNLHPGTYLVDLLNIPPHVDLPPLDALGQYLGFYDSSGLHRGCSVKYCLGPINHRVHAGGPRFDAHEVDNSNEGEENSSQHPEVDSESGGAFKHHARKDRIKTKLPLWY
jgi:hypothetical protein